MEDETYHRKAITGEGDGTVECADGKHHLEVIETMSSDVFLLADPTSDSKLAHNVKLALEARKVSVAPVVDSSKVHSGSDFRTEALALLERSGCLVFLQTKSALQASTTDEDMVGAESAGMFCADMIHAAYEANCHIIVVNMEEGACSPSLMMMMQMAPKIATTEKLDKNEELEDDEIEKVVFEVLKMKYAAEEEQDAALPMDVKLAQLHQS